MNSINTIFIGTSYEGVETLTNLINSEKYNVVAVITQPDKPVGRKQEVKSTIIKEIAIKHNISVYTPQKGTSEYKKALLNHKPDLIITISFGKIIPKSVIDYPKYKCLNIHYSLLPELRGATPVPMAILRGLSKTGVTIQIMEPTLDTGPILAQEQIDIEKNDTTFSLKEKLIEIGTKLLMTTLDKWINGKIEPIHQPQDICDYCHQEDMSKEKAEIDWQNMSPEYIERMIRAFNPWPIAWTTLSDDKKLKIYEASLAEISHKHTPGTIFKENKKIYFATKDKCLALELNIVQKEGKNQMTGEQFFSGYQNNKIQV